MDVIKRLRFENIIKECEKKQDGRKLAWFEKNYEKVFQNPSLPQLKNASKLYEEIVKSRREGCEYEKKLKEDIISRNRPKSSWESPKSEKGEVGFTKEELFPPPMTKVPEDVREQLYQGISHNSEGRAAYLSVRSKFNPDERYTSKWTGNFEYGWKIKERAPRADKRFARRKVLAPGMYRRYGALELEPERQRLPFSSGHIVFDFL